MTIVVPNIVALLAVFYLGIGVGVFLMLREKYRYHMGGPPAMFFLLAIVRPFAILKSYREAEEDRRKNNLRDS